MQKKIYIILRRISVIKIEMNKKENNGNNIRILEEEAHGKV
jgi:hypothetical protein